MLSEYILDMNQYQVTVYCIYYSSYEIDNKVRARLGACAKSVLRLLAVTLTLQTPSVCTHACGDESVTSHKAA